MAAGELGPVYYLYARRDQPRPDPRRRQRHVGPRLPRRLDLQLSPRTTAGVGQRRRSGGARQRPRGRRLRLARVPRRDDRPHPRQLGRPAEGAARWSSSAARAGSSSTTSTRLGAGPGLREGRRRAGPTPAPRPAARFRCGTAPSSARPSRRREPLRNQCMHFLSCIVQGAARSPAACMGRNVVGVLEAVERSMRRGALARQAPREVARRRKMHRWTTLSRRPIPFIDLSAQSRRARGGDRRRALRVLCRATTSSGRTSPASSGVRGVLRGRARHRRRLRHLGAGAGAAAPAASAPATR